MNERSETEEKSDGDYTRFLGVSAKLSLLKLCRVPAEAVKFSIGEIKILQCRV